MTFEEWADQIWQQIGQLEAEHAQLERSLQQMAGEDGCPSPEAAALMERIQELGEHLVRLDEECADLLKRGGWA